jgi:hypothetical protein
MREIDPIREPSEALLSSALHRLASAAEHNAPAALQASLVGEFRRHHRRRRQKRLLAAASVSVCLLLLAAMLKMLAPLAGDERAKVRTPEAQSVAGAPAKPLTTNRFESNQISAPAISGQRRAASDVQTGNEPDGFIALPSYDPATASGELQVVRVELPGSELRMLGAPVVGDLSDQPVTADFITDRDGTPYAVRLVQ